MYSTPKCHTPRRKQGRSREVNRVRHYRRCLSRLRPHVSLKLLHDAHCKLEGSSRRSLSTSWRWFWQRVLRVSRRPRCWERRKGYIQGPCGPCRRDWRESRACWVMRRNSRSGPSTSIVQGHLGQQRYSNRLLKYTAKAVPRFETRNVHNLPYNKDNRTEGCRASDQWHGRHASPDTSGKATASNTYLGNTTPNMAYVNQMVIRYKPLKNPITLNSTSWASSILYTAPDVSVI
jgi:hypothetical protein